MSEFLALLFACVGCYHQYDCCIVSMISTSRTRLRWARALQTLNATALRKQKTVNPNLEPRLRNLGVLSHETCACSPSNQTNLPLALFSRPRALSHHRQILSMLLGVQGSSARGDLLPHRNRDKICAFQGKLFPASLVGSTAKDCHDRGKGEKSCMV